MTTFALIRHARHALLGQTIVGRTPGVQLTSSGLQEAEGLARRLAGSPIQALYSSPLSAPAPPRQQSPSGWASR